MDPYTTSVTIARPRERLFAYLADVANLSEITDHFLADFRLLREDTLGRGAGVRFRLRKAPFNRFAWADLTWAEVEPPRRLTGVGRLGKYNRTRVLYELSLEPGPGGVTRVTLTVRTQPKLLSDRLMEALGTARGLRRGWRRALKRLRDVHEEDRNRGRRATIAGGPRKPATGSPINALGGQRQAPGAG